MKMFIHHSPLPASPGHPLVPRSSGAAEPSPAQGLQLSPPPFPAQSLPRFTFPYSKFPPCPESKAPFFPECWDPLALRAPHSLCVFFPLLIIRAPWLEPESRAAPFAAEHICSQGWRGALERLVQGGRQRAVHRTRGHGSLSSDFKGKPAQTLQEQPSSSGHKWGHTSVWLQSSHLLLSCSAPAEQPELALKQGWVGTSPSPPTSYTSKGWKHLIEGCESSQS